MKHRERWEYWLCGVLHSIFPPCFLTPPKLSILLFSVDMMVGRTRELSGWHLSPPAAFLRPFREFSEHNSVSCNSNRFFLVRFIKFSILTLFLLQMTNYFMLQKK